MKKQPGFFDSDNVLSKLSKIGDPLEKLNKIIDWDVFNDTLNEIFQRKSPKELGGRPPYDIVMMFKILILQKLYGLSDDKTEYHIIDRMTFRRFLGLELYDNVPDAKTIWLFREKITESGQMKKLFDTFNESLALFGVEKKDGVIVDASFVDVPKQRNNRDENDKIKNGELPEEWKKNENKLEQKDLDASWAKKNKETHFGYKNHIKVEIKTKLIKNYTVSTAKDHDSEHFLPILDESDDIAYADSAYRSDYIEKALEKMGIESMIHSKGYRNNPLSEVQKLINKALSRVRSRVEHVFGWIKNTANGDFIRSIGIERAETNIGLINLTYNLNRLVSLLK